VTKRRALVAVLGLVTAVLVPTARALEVHCAPAAGGGDWPVMGGDLRSSRTQPAERSIKPPLTAVWTFDANRWTHTTDNEVTGYPIVADGCVFVGSSTGNDGEGRHKPGWVFALNADTGDVVWQTRVPGGVYSTVAVDKGVVYAFVSRVGSPLLVALDAATGHQLWSTVVDRQQGSDAVASPVVFDGMVWVGVSGTAAEGDASDRNAFQGSTVLVAAQRLTAPRFSPVDADRSSGWATYRPGQVIRKLWSIPPAQWSKGYAGGAQWGTIAIDPTTGYGFEGTGNPFNYDAEHRNTNAVLKIDLRRTRATFGRITGSYKGTIEEYVPNGASTVPCEDLTHVSGLFAMGVECVRLDLDFGATPNILRVQGRTVIAAGQKSGVVHFFDAASMKPVAKPVVGVPSQVGGVVGSAAYDGTTLYGPHTLGGYLWALGGADQQLKWLTPTADGVHWGPPVTWANHVLYTVDLTGFLDAYDAGTGLPLMHLPMALSTDTATVTRPPLSWGGVTVARNLVYASVGVGLTSGSLPSVPGGFVIAYAPLHLSP
jgi:polyvinyl alcohol dehydrogenase (cytochrome)